MPALTPVKALKALPASATTTTTTTPTSRVLTTVHEKTSSNKGVADLSTVKYYNYNKFGYYATSCT
jgi:hypothetical protein